MLDIPETSSILEKFSSKVKTYEVEIFKRSLFDELPSMAFIINNKGYFVDVNDVTCQNLGYRKEDMLNHHYAEFMVDPKDLSATNFDQATIHKNVYIKSNGDNQDMYWLSFFNYSDKDYSLALAIPSLKYKNL